MTSINKYLGVKSFTAPNRIKFIQGKESAEWEYNDMVKQFDEIVKSLGFFWDRALTKQYGNEGAVVSYRDDKVKIRDKKYDKQMQSLGKKMGDALRKGANGWARDNNIKLKENAYEVHTFGDTFIDEVVLGGGENPLLDDRKERARVGKTLYDVSVQFYLSHYKDNMQSWQEIIKILDVIINDKEHLNLSKTPRSLYRIYRKIVNVLNKIDRIEQIVANKEDMPYRLQDSGFYQTMLHWADKLENDLPSDVNDLPMTSPQLTEEQQDKLERLYTRMIEASKTVQNLKNLMEAVLNATDSDAEWNKRKSINNLKFYLGKASKASDVTIEEGDILPVTNEFIKDRIKHKKRSWVGGMTDADRDKWISIMRTWDNVEVVGVGRSSGEVIVYPNGEWVMPQVPMDILIEMKEQKR